MAVNTQSTTTSNEVFGPEHTAKIAWWLKTPALAPIKAPTWQPLSIECPECGHSTQDGECYSFDCTIGFHNVQVELGTYTPEDWLMVEGGASASPIPFADLDSITFPELLEVAA